MTAAARARKKANHRRCNPHPVHVQKPDPDHPRGAPLPVLCPACYPPPKARRP